MCDPSCRECHASLLEQTKTARVTATITAFTGFIISSFICTAKLKTWSAIVMVITISKGKWRPRLCVVVQVAKGHGNGTRQTGIFNVNGGDLCQGHQFTRDIPRNAWIAIQVQHFQLIQIPNGARNRSFKVVVAQIKPPLQIHEQEELRDEWTSHAIVGQRQFAEINICLDLSWDLSRNAVVAEIQSFQLCHGENCIGYGLQIVLFHIEGQQTLKRCKLIGQRIEVVVVQIQSQQIGVRRRAILKDE